MALCLLFGGAAVHGGGAGGEVSPEATTTLEPRSPGLETRVRLPDGGIALEFPGTWLVKRDASPFVVVAELPPRQALAMVSRREQENDEGAMEELEALRFELAAAFDESEILSVQRWTTAGGVTVDAVEVAALARGIRFRHSTFLFRTGDVRYTLTFVTEESLHGPLEATFHRIASTLARGGSRPLDQRFLAMVDSVDPDYRALEELLAEGAEIDVVSDRGFSALGHAVLRRNGPLVRWLLDRGADPSVPPETASMLPMIASPPIYELLSTRGLLSGQPQAQGWTSQRPEGLKIEWVSPEAQLFAGILNARLDDVRDALENGASLEQLEPSYRLPALPLTRQLLAEFDELGLDDSPLRPIESLLVAISTEP